MMTRARKVWDRLAKTKVWVPRLPAYEQTRLSWARVTGTWDEVPEVFREPLTAVAGEGGSLPYTVLTPTVQGFLRRPGEKLICTAGDEIWVMEKVQNVAVSTCYPVAGISRIEVGSVLLKGWMTIRGVDRSGTPKGSTVEFNTVGEGLLTPIVAKARPAPVGSGGVEYEAEIDKLRGLAPLNFKFMNYARRTIVPGERVIRFVLQPEVRARAPRLLGRQWWGRIYPAHLTVVTDKELIDIRDEAGVRWNPDAKHGGIWTFVRLEQVVGTAVEEEEDGMVRLAVELVGGDGVEVVFAGEREEEVRGMMGDLTTKYTKDSKVIA